MAADFQNVYRYNVSLCWSVVLADVSEHNSNPAGENELRFVVVTCAFLLIAWFWIPACFRATSWEKKCGCSFLVPRTKCVSEQPKEIVTFFSKNNNFLSRPIKTSSSTTGSSATMFCTQTPAHWHLKIPIKWYGSIYGVSLVRKKRSSICPEKATEKFLLPWVPEGFLPRFPVSLLWPARKTSQWSRARFLWERRANDKPV